MEIKFNSSKDFTVGVELEIQLIDSHTLGLTQSSTAIIDSLGGFKDSVKHELMMSNLEVVSKKCVDVDEAEKDLREKLKVVIDAAAKHSTLLAMAGTHPFSLWRDQSVTEDQRYEQLIDVLQMVGRRFNIFGLHVHVGVNGGDRCIYIMNRLLYYLPHLLAVSTNSPFWEGENTGLKSYRTKVFESLPIGGLPFYFHNFSDYEKLISNYLATSTIKTIRELWWDIRPHPDFGTIEVRVCDIPSTLREVMCLAALIQAFVKRFSDDFDRGVCFRRPHSAIIRENKWRACRYGMDGEFITEDGGRTVKARDAVKEIMDWVGPDSRELGSYGHFRIVEEILLRGTGAARQVQVWKEKGDLKEVVRAMVDELNSEIVPGRGGTAR
ncbi:MAG: glutamate--cysteine ligase [Thermodesulfobacteriota bacterium]|nr:MAG: glutamate--cysteine ligase [Thermodesulfobacteriota bacterium]